MPAGQSQVTPRHQARPQTARERTAQGTTLFCGYYSSPQQALRTFTLTPPPSLQWWCKIQTRKPSLPSPITSTMATSSQMQTERFLSKLTEQTLQHPGLHPTRQSTTTPNDTSKHCGYSTNRDVLPLILDLIVRATKSCCTRAHHTRTYSSLAAAANKQLSVLESLCPVDWSGTLQTVPGVPERSQSSQLNLFVTCSWEI